MINTYSLLNFIWDTFRYTLNCKFDPWKFCLDYLIGCLNSILALISYRLFIYACLMVPFIAKRRILNHNKYLRKSGYKSRYCNTHKTNKALAHLLSKSIWNRNSTVKMYSMSPIWKTLAFIKVAIAIMIHKWDEFSSQMKRNSFRTTVNVLLPSGPCRIYEAQIKWIYVLIKHFFWSYLTFDDFLFFFCCWYLFMYRLSLSAIISNVENYLKLNNFVKDSILLLKLWHTVFRQMSTTRLKC